MKVLVLNSGSSSLKACLYEFGDTPPGNRPMPLWEGRIEWNDESAEVSVKANGVAKTEVVAVNSREQVVRELIASSWNGEAQAIRSAEEIQAVGHRVVHGGPVFQAPVLITDEVYATINEVAAFAPLHIIAEVEGINIVRSMLGNVPQIAVFDTGFHRQMPLAAAIYPGPYDWFENGIHRYGFHGINHKYCLHRSAQLLGRDATAMRVVTCHLGNGCSVAAIDKGRSVDTTMGFTPLDGLMMGTRSGSVDPGILTFLMRQSHVDANELDLILNHQSGLLGISGVSSDMREILAHMNNGHERARLAFDIYIHRLRGAIGSMAAALGGIDALVFTAGVGENSPEVRAAACSNLQFMGIELDSDLNVHAAPDQDIAAAESQVRVLVIRAEEAWAIAAECWKLLRESSDACLQRSAFHGRSQKESGLHSG